MTDWTADDEAEFQRLRNELQQDTAADPNDDETEEDGIKAERVRRLMARRKLAMGRGS